MSIIIARIFSKSKRPRYLTMEQSNDLWDDMATLNSLYGELCWNHEDPLEFIPDYENDRIITVSYTHLTLPTKA